MRLSSFLGIPSGHSNLSFVDITTNWDTELFIDPCLIERGTDPLSREATVVFNDFADQLYADMRSSRWVDTVVFNEAHEINETHLGYGNGRNGKGKTPTGMHTSLAGLCNLANDIPTISCIQDIPVFVQDFAEDCMSDLLTNILRHQLCRFTAEQMQYYGHKPDGFHNIRTWNHEIHGWSSSKESYWEVDGHKVLLVPKWWVRKNYLFKAHQYLYTVIIERMRADSGFHNFTKKEIWNNLMRTTEHWEYDEVTQYTVKQPDALSEYHRRMPLYYNRSYGCMSDEALDEAVYIENSTEVA